MISNARSSGLRRAGPRPSQASIAALAAAALLAAAGTARAQQPRSMVPTRDSTMTLMTSPPQGRLFLRGASEVTGSSPLELGPQWTGHYSVRVEAPGDAMASGSLDFLPGAPPTSSSEPPGFSGKLLLRALYFPGMPQLLAGNPARGVAFLAAGLGGVGSVVRDHVGYRDKVKGTDFESRDEASDFRYARGRWTLYTSAVWGMSAVDYMLRARMQLVLSTSNRVVLGAPELTRGNVILRSAIVPGAGQDYANQRTRGFLWLSGTVMAGAAYFVADESHHRLLTKLHRAELRLLTATPSEIPALQADVIRFTNKERSSYDLLSGLGLAMAGIYAANIIDAGMLPLHSSESWKQSSTSISVPMQRGRVAVAITRRF